MSHPDTPYGSAGDPTTSTAQQYPTSAQPVEGWPSEAGAGPTRRSGQAVAAFVVGLVSILLCLIPFVNIVSIIGGIVAVVLGIVALRKLAPGVTGKGFAVAGIILGGLSLVVAALVLVVTGLAVQSAIDSGDLDAAIEEAAAAQEPTSTEEAVEDAGDVPVEDAPVATDEVTADSAGDPAAVPGDVARPDFSDVDCDLLAEEVVLMSQEEVNGVRDLVKIRESTVVEDHRTDYAIPAGVEESLVLSCRGTAAWDDTTESPVLTELTIDADGEVFIAYVGE